MNIFSSIAKFFGKIGRWSKRHKFWSILIAIVILYGAYYAYASRTNAPQTAYVLAQVQKGTLITSVSGTGQVSASNQLDIKPQVSGDVTYVAIKSGQQVKAGQLLLSLDSTDAQKAVRDAQSNLDSAKLSLQKLQEPTDQLSLIQAENALAQAQQSEQNATSDLAKAYDDGFTSVSNAFLDLPGTMTGLKDILYGNSLNSQQTNAYAYANLAQNYITNINDYRDAALNSYQTAYTAYQTNFNDYKNASRGSSTTTTESLINETYNTTKTISDALKDTKNFLDQVNNALTNSAQLVRPPAILSTHENSIQSYTQTTNSHLGDLLTIENTIKNDKDAITNSQGSISEKTQALVELKAGANPIDIQSQQLSIEQKQNALLDAQQTLNEYSIRAPFDGVIAALNVNKGDSASPSTAVATIITTNQLAEVSLNEVDAAKIQLGQKVTLTFDAFPDLTIGGEVAQIDTIGTVSQGVVTYNVQISFTTQDSRVKPGMSVSASIVTNVKQDVLLIPSSAVKTQGSSNYVQVPASIPAGQSQSSLTNSQGVSLSAAPITQSVQIGDSNDTQTEISSGLKEGDYVIVRAITSSATAQTTQNSSSIRIPGITGGGGGGGTIFRAGGGATGR